MTISDIFHWFATGFGSILALGQIELSAVDTPMLGAFVAAFVQMFYCYRIYTINKMAWGIAVVVALVRAFFDLDAIIFTMILLLPQLALTEIVAGLYGAVVVRSFIPPLLYSVVNSGPTGRTSEDVFESRE